MKPCLTVMKTPPPFDLSLDIRLRRQMVQPNGKFSLLLISEVNQEFVPRATSGMVTSIKVANSVTLLWMEELFRTAILKLLTILFLLCW